MNIHSMNFEQNELTNNNASIMNSSNYDQMHTNAFLSIDQDNDVFDPLTINNDWSIPIDNNLMSDSPIQNVDCTESQQHITRSSFDTVDTGSDNSLFNNNDYEACSEFINKVRPKRRSAPKKTTETKHKKAKGGTFTSQYRGVYKRNDKWNSQIQYQGKKKYLGSYPYEIEAARAYDEAAIRYHASRAVTNFDYSKADREKIVQGQCTINNYNESVSVNNCVKKIKENVFDTNQVYTDETKSLSSPVTTTSDNQSQKITIANNIQITNLYATTDTPHIFSTNTSIPFLSPNSNMASSQSINNISNTTLNYNPTIINNHNSLNNTLIYNDNQTNYVANINPSTTSNVKPTKSKYDIIPFDELLRRSQKQEMFMKQFCGKDINTIIAANKQIHLNDYSVAF
ncbi:hypothetical protein WA158_007657 [Blastocystis sp. Blastoise]